MQLSTEIKPNNKGGRPRRLDKSITPKRSRGRPKSQWLTFTKARAFARTLNLKDYEEWVKYSKKRDKKTNHRLRPKDIPPLPHLVYKGRGWLGYGNFLGAKRQYFPYEKLKIEAIKLGIKSVRAWFRWWEQHRPKMVPRNPHLHYEEWENWNIFLGTKNRPANERQKDYISYISAKKIVHPLKLRHKREYREWFTANRLKYLPSHPEDVYKNKGWVSWKDWLGTTLAARLESKSDNTTVLYVSHHTNMPDNVFEVATNDIGKESVIEKQNKTAFSLIKIYKLESEMKPKVDYILARYCSSYWEGNKQYIISNLPQMLFELDEILFWA